MTYPVHHTDTAPTPPAPAPAPEPEPLGLQDMHPEVAAALLARLVQQQPAHPPAQVHHETVVERVRHTHTPIPSPAPYLPGHQAAPVAPTPAPTAPAPVPVVDNRISGKDKGRALVITSGGAGLGATTYGLSELASNSDGLMTAAIALAIITGSVTLGGLIVRFGFGIRLSKHGDTAKGGDTHITQHITAKGMFGKASGTVNNQ